MFARVSHIIYETRELYKYFVHHASIIFLTRKRKVVQIRNLPASMSIYEASNRERAGLVDDLTFRKP